MKKNIQNPISIETLFNDYQQNIEPYHSGNMHHGFLGWVQGGGNIAGILGELAAAGLNMNCGGRDHVGIEIEKQILFWVKEWFRYPETANGLFVTGTSFANFLAIVTAKGWKLGFQETRINGLLNGKRPIIFTSITAHKCIIQVLELSGLGSKSLRLIPTNSNYQIDVQLLKDSIESVLLSDNEFPLMIIGTAGSVDVGAIDDLNELSLLAKQYDFWFHIDGAFGALGILSPIIAPMLNGIENSDSIAFDFHKWGQVPYDAGFLIVKNQINLLNTFSTSVSYLKHELSGLAAGDIWPSDIGPDLSRGCRALKTYFTLKTIGINGLSQQITKSYQLAHLLELLINNDYSSQLEILAPVTLNIVCFRYNPKFNKKNENFNLEQLNEINKIIVIKLHYQSIVAPSLTNLLINNNKYNVIRACFINHRNQTQDVYNLIENVIKFGDEIF